MSNPRDFKLDRNLEWEISMLEPSCKRRIEEEVARAIWRRDKMLDNSFMAGYLTLLFTYLEKSTKSFL